MQKTAGFLKVLSQKERNSLLERYLLFDAKCSSCTHLAERIEQASGGWLQARSLRDREMQAYVTRAGKQLPFEPTLVEVTEKRVQIFTGLAFRRKMLLGLGPRRMWRTLLLVTNQQQPSASGPGRRQLLTWGSALVGGLALGLGWQKSVPAFAHATSQRTSLYQRTPLVAEEATQLFADHPLLQRATSQFGSVDWTGVIRFTRRETQEYSYGLPLGNESSVPSILMLGEIGKKASDSSKGLVIQAKAEERGRTTFQLFLPNGQQGASLLLDKGKLVENPPTVASPDVNWQCVAACTAAAIAAGDDGSCIDACQVCAAGSGVSRAAACISCLICAGPVIYDCFKTC